MYTLDWVPTGKLLDISLAIYSYVVGHPEGLHARPAALLAEFLAQKSPNARVSSSSNASASGGSVLEIMLLGLKCGDSIQIELERELDQFEQDALWLLVAGPVSN